MTDLIWSFSPWVSFLLGVRVGNVYSGAGLGAVVAIVVLARAISRGKTHMFDYVGVVYFAARLYVSRKAVEYHLSNIYAKMGVTSRRELRGQFAEGLQ